MKSILLFFYNFERLIYCFYQKYLNTKDVQFLKNAEQNYQAAIDFIQQVKLNFRTTAAQFSLGDYTHEFYEDLLKCRLE